MKYTPATIEEARRLAQQAEAQVTVQLEMIERMKRSGLSTAVTEGSASDDAQHRGANARAA